MTGKRGRSGRPPGSLSFTPTRLAGELTGTLMIMWLSGVAFRDIPPCPPERQLAPMRPPELRLAMGLPERDVVPLQVRRTLAGFAIKHLHGIHRDDPNWREPHVDGVLAWVRQHAPVGTLLRRWRQSGL
jgi:hypothetical protein